MKTELSSTQKRVALKTVLESNGFQLDGINHGRQRDKVEFRRAGIAILTTEIYPQEWSVSGRIMAVGHAAAIYHHRKHFDLYETNAYYREIFDRIYGQYQLECKLLEMNTVETIAKTAVGLVND